MSHASTIEQPYFMYDPSSGRDHHNIEGSGVQIMSIDNLPTELPYEASKYFSEALYPWVKEIVKNNFSHPVVSRATISLPTGELAPQHEKLYGQVAKFGDVGVKVAQRQKVLLLGSGYVAKPLVDYLTRDGKYDITIGK